MNRKRFRAGLIGCGNVVLNAHIPAIRQVVEIEPVAVADPVASLRTTALEQLGLPPSAGYASYLEMLAEQRPDYVVLATPPSVRLEIVRECARAGIHILAEKPAAAIPREADEQAERMRSAGCTFGFVHNYLFYPEYLRLRKMVAEREIGVLRHATLNFLGVEDRPGNHAYRPGWRHDPGAGGGGVLMDMIHAIYLAEFLAGGEIRAVGAVVDNLGYPTGAVEDIALVQLHFENAYVTIHMGWGSGPGGIEMTGSEGRALVFYRDYRTGPFDHLESITRINAEGRLDYSPESQYDGTLNFVEIHRDFIRAIRDGRPPAAPAAAANRSLEAALAAYVSAYQGRVVDLPFEKSDPVYLQGVAGLADLPGRPDNPITRRGLFLRNPGA
ncbi:MAG TPA: Gfo/Idh/MocA family oxidoreductase [Anaerolineales bacterium]|nr:Gfo/Idh/MocA family oxidoreductase [Anaerolineales bacterium]